MQTYENKKACSHMNLRSHTRDEARSPDQSAFLDSSYGQCGECFTDAESHSGLGRECNMKVCLVVFKSRLLEHILLFNSWPSRCPLSVQIEERNSSKAPKDRFSKRTHFSGVRSACTSVVHATFFRKVSDFYFQKKCKKESKR
jgi:hypothetical protein